MTEIKNGDAVTPGPVTVVVETDDHKTYKIGTTDLGTMATQLRPKTTFSVFNSILVPIGVTVLTALLTTAVGQFFQYISWRNSTALQEAQDQITRATAAYVKAATAIDTRRYATFVFLDAVQDLINRKEDVGSPLFELDLELNKRRFDNYYSQLNLWNEANDQILGEIDFGLDRPVGISARKRSAEIAQIDCTKSLPEQLTAHGLVSASLKLQFAVITRCFATGILAFAQAKDQAVLNSKAVLDDTVKADAVLALNNVLSMSNEFRCYALSRIEFLRSRQGRAIYIPDWLARFRGYTSQSREAIDKKEHFDRTAKECSFY